ncbi:ABC transporter substrate-binding protein [Clostridium lundense]|uniref:ABC transporter substrate-binding protein n=1 Tax=Clostridium lundense TaxID=319475 RepID=UPI000489439D|nr:ABC transporter substrate-binding protein [Clostridium lundense]
MRKGKKIILAGALIIVVMFSVLSGCTTTQGGKKEETKKIVDMRGKNIEIPKDPKRVVIVDKGFIVQTMVAMGIQDKIVASGGIIQGKEPKPEDRDTLWLFPKIIQLPNIGYSIGGFNYEALANANPDLVLWRNSEYIKDKDVTTEAMNKIENEFKIPLVVINGPGCYDDVKLETQYEGIKLLGKVFGKEKRAKEMIAYMEEQIDMIKTRTANIPNDKKPSAMYIGLKGDSSVGSVWGKNFGDAKFSEEICNIKNVYDKHESKKMSSEQIITLNPDAIILCTNSVKPNPKILSNDPAYKSLRDVNAVRNGRVTSLGLLTWWGDFRLEFPTILLISAKSAYPDKFTDIKVSQWLDEYHKRLYNISDSQAKELKGVQYLKWMDECNF